MRKQDWANKIEPAQIKSIRTHLKINQTELGRLLGVTQATVSSWENQGAQGPTAFALRALEQQETPTPSVLAPNTPPPEVYLALAIKASDTPGETLVSKLAEAVLEQIFHERLTTPLKGIEVVRIVWDQHFKPVDANKRFPKANYSFIPIGGQLEIDVQTSSDTNPLLWKRLQDSNSFAIALRQYGTELMFISNLTQPPSNPFAAVSSWTLQIEQTYYKPTEQNG